MPPYSVEFFQMDSGRCPVEEFLNDLSRKQPKAWSKCMSCIALLEEQGWALIPKHQYAEKVEQNMWVLRPAAQNVEYRLFFTWDPAEQVFVLVDAIAKKTQQLTDRDRRRARARIREVLNG